MSRLFEELKRRSVFRVGLTYLVAAWVLLQVTALVAPELLLPAWTTRLVLLLLALGFIPALILAWAYELTPEGIKRDEEAAFHVRDAGRRVTPAELGTALLLVVGMAGSGLYYYLGNDARWARDVAYPEIERYAANGEWESAYRVAKEVATRLPDDNELGELWSSFSWMTSIPTTPTGATVYRRPYADISAEWELLGTTPLYNVHIPMGPSLLRMELDGHPPLLRVIGGEINSSTEIPVWAEPFTTYGQITSGAFDFDSADTVPVGMVRVPAQRLTIDGQAVDMPDFHIARFEVTNREFKAFVDAGGYANPAWWKHDFILDGEPVSFEDAQARFVDTTGRPGPATWEAGSYPDGEDEYPVGGISWYEAAAFAEYSGRDLPTLHHWRRATAGVLLPWLLPVANLDSDGPVAVGSSNALDWTGAYDLAGNVREWCDNAVNDQRAILGAGWDDPAYAVLESLTDPAALPAFDRSPTNGFRLALLSGDRATLAALRRPVEPAQEPVIGEPATDDVYAVLLNNFRYDPVPLEPQAEEMQEERHWTRQRITVVTGYGNERLPLYLYLPKGGDQRYQAVLFWPTSGAVFQDSIDSQRFALDFIVQNGRAVILPVYDGTFERRRGTFPGWNSVAGRDMLIADMKDMRRAIDYLETRPDIDADALAYFGFSWGGRLGAIALAIEPRFKAGILNQAGLQNLSIPETSVLNYLPHVRVPVLQFNGRYDTDFRFETSAKPFFDLLGTDPSEKKQVIEPTGHFVSRPVVIGESLDWLDKYLGPVRP